MAARRGVLKVLCSAMVAVAAGLPAEPVAGEAPASSDPAADSPDAVVRAYLELWTTGELGALSEIVADDFQRLSRPAESPSSASELADLIRATRANYRFLRIEPTLVVCEGERCAMTGKFQAGILDSPKGFDMLTSAFFHLEDGKISKEWVLANNLPSFIGVGYTIAPPGSTVVPAAVPGKESP